MEIITLESSAYKELFGRIERISAYIEKQEKRREQQENNTEVWLTTRQVMAMLNISQRTLQRMRDSNRIAYSFAGHNCRYHIKEVERFIREGIIIGDPERLEEFKHNYKARMGGKKSRNRETKE
ncbi:helix-turn-helix domain-containing protein [Phocaeicola sp.]|uniref:helix-turn-helix domain-containing protein n=1 Tax=Phocaeicola sp. TaxID=2773926 RepID=UPI004028BCFA